MNGRTLVGLALGAALLACGGNVDATPKPPPSTDWVGTWAGEKTGDAMVLTITDDGMVHYERSGSMQTQLDMPAQSWTDDSFTIGLSLLSTTFHVEQKPHEDGGVWKMTVEGFEMTKEPSIVPSEPAPEPEPDEPAVTAP